MHSLRVLLASAIDYAGLFPPASLDMTSAVWNYGSYRQSEDAWALGRFIVPVSRLSELERATEKLANRGASPWHLSALAGASPKNDISSIIDFTSREKATGMVIDAVELKASSVSEIAGLAGTIPSTLTTYMEIPIGSEPAPLIAAIHGSGLRAKVRTGGVTENASPSTTNLARFIQACATAKVPFKATAGLHHPLRARYRLTYEPESPQGMMFGFLNVFVAAGVAYAGGNVEDVTAVLEEQDISAFNFNDGGFSWRSNHIEEAKIAPLRSEFAISFGSCSFTEPIQDLQTLGVL